MVGFKTFVIFAEMRTGSNLLEASLDALAGVTCHGELFNPHFIGGPNRDSVLGFTQQTRDRDPLALLEAVKAGGPGLQGLRFFHDHDPRVLDALINDPACAKIILTRNPVDTFVSRKIAAETGQWRLSSAQHKKTARIAFDMDEFSAYLDARAAFQADLRGRLQRAGQAAFSVTYEDIQKIDVVNGIATYLGVDARLKNLPKTLVRQNAGSMRDRVSNFAQMKKALRGFDWLDLDRAPSFEPQRGAAVPKFVAAAKSPLIYLPVPGGPTGEVTNWLTALDGKPPTTGHTQKTLRQWQKRNPGFRSFTIIRHPLDRAFTTFMSLTDAHTPPELDSVKAYLGRHFMLTKPGKPANPRAEFQAYLEFAELNLSGQTPIRVQPDLATQSAIVQGFGRVLSPDQIIREREAPRALKGLVGKQTQAPEFGASPNSGLGEIYDAKLEKLARRAYGRDYLRFGFEDWA